MCRQQDAVEYWQRQFELGEDARSDAMFNARSLVDNIRKKSGHRHKTRDNDTASMKCLATF
jgi:hypothetical protein